MEIVKDTATAHAERILTGIRSNVNKAKPPKRGKRKFNQLKRLVQSTLKQYKPGYIECFSWVQELDSRDNLHYEFEIKSHLLWELEYTGIIDKEQLDFISDAENTVLQPALF